MRAHTHIHPYNHRDVRERKKNLLRYTPDVARAIAAVLNGVNKRKRFIEGGAAAEEDEEGAHAGQQQRPKDEKQAKLYEEIEKRWRATTTSGALASSSLLGLVTEAGNMNTFDVSKFSPFFCLLRHTSLFKAHA